jgi:hypothetical protein
MKATKKSVKSNPKRLSLFAPPSFRKKLEYDKDFFKWTKTQAGLLKKRKLEDLDIDNLIEEIESLGRSDKRALRSHLIILLMHLLKKKYQPTGQGNSSSWDASIENSALEINLILEDSPSLKKELKLIYENSYAYARKKAAIETRLNIKTFPEKCPWEIQEIL